MLDDPVAPPGGGVTSLAALLIAEPRKSLGLIRHWNLRRAITVEADLDKDRSDALTANNRLRAEWEKICPRYPGVNLDLSGELDDLDESRTFASSVRPEALSKGIHRLKTGFDRLTPNGF